MNNFRLSTFGFLMAVLISFNAHAKESECYRLKMYSVGDPAYACLSHFDINNPWIITAISFTDGDHRVIEEVEVRGQIVDLQIGRHSLSFFESEGQSQVFNVSVKQWIGNPKPNTLFIRSFLNGHDQDPAHPKTYEPVDRPCANRCK